MESKDNREDGKDREDDLDLGGGTVFFFLSQ